MVTPPQPSISFENFGASPAAAARARSARNALA
jgi:hypothetical protein